MRIGLISDTHGLLRPEAVAALQGCAQIIHAGDIGKPQVLDGAARHRAAGGDPRQYRYGRLGAGAARTPRPAHRGLTLHVLHDLKQLDIDPLAAGVDVVIAGHSHKPKVERRDGVLYVNPGSAGPRRFSLPISLALLELNDGQAQVELISLS